MVEIPKIFERKIIQLKKPGGSTQYFITLPKEFAEKLKAQKVDSLLIIFNYGLGAFPKNKPKTEEALLTFLQKHHEFKELFMAGDSHE